MANPRKFADKLEIIRRKEEEANAEFEKIMREVSDAKVGELGVGQRHNSWGVNRDYLKMRAKYKGGSLPNVNLSPNPLEMQNMFNVGEIYQQQPPQYMNMAPMRRAVDHTPSGPIFPSKTKQRAYTCNTPYRSVQPNLLPNPDTGNEQSMWGRRTFSDSAIQQTLQQPQPAKKMGQQQQQQQQQDGNSMQGSVGPRMIQTPASGKTQILTNYGSPPSPFNDSGSGKTHHIQAQANTGSLPDLSNLHIPSPLQNPIDTEDKANQQMSQQNPFQVPTRTAPRRHQNVGKQVFPRQISNPDVVETMNREQKLQQLSLFPGVNVEKNDINLMGITPGSGNNSSAPLSPNTPNHYYWSGPAMSPLAQEALLQQQQQPSHVTNQTELQQQLQQFQMGEGQMRNPPPPYPYVGGDNNMNNFYFGAGNVPYSKQSIYRTNSAGKAVSSPVMQSKVNFDPQSPTIPYRPDSNDLSEDDLHQVRVALDPLDFEDIRVLQGDNSALVVDQSAEEQFRNDWNGQSF